MEIAEYLHVLLKRWWVIVIAVVFVLIATSVLTLVQRPLYRAETSVVVVLSASLQGSGPLLQGLDTLARGGAILETYKGIATSQTIVEAAAQEIGLSDEELRRYDVTSSNSQGSNIITIAVEGPDSDRVNALIHRVAVQTIQYTSSLYAPYNLRLLDRTVGPAKLISPKPLQNLILGGILGIGLGLVLVFLFEYLRRPQDVVVQQNILDPVTGVLDKTFFMCRLNQELARSRRQNYSLSIALLHVQNLDQLRGNRAPELRNQALRQVARCLVSRLRPEDLIARIDQDKFALLFPDVPGGVAKEKLKYLQGWLEWTVFEIEPVRIRLSVQSSSGLMSFKYGLTADEMVTKADQALRLAGTNGHERIHLWQEQEVRAG